MAALMIRNGKQYDNDSLLQKGLELSKAIAYQTWDKTSNGYAFKTPESWVVLNKDPTPTVKSRFPCQKPSCGPTSIGTCTTDDP